MEADIRHLRCAAPTPFTTALVRAFAFALARSRAIPIVSPFCPAQNPFAGVREDEPLNTLEANEQRILMCMCTQATLSAAGD